jgi:hypothetical protein
MTNIWGVSCLQVIVFFLSLYSCWIKCRGPVLLHATWITFNCLWYISNIYTVLNPYVPVILYDNLQRVSQTLRSSYVSHVTTAVKQADQYWQLHCSDCKKTLIYAHTTSRTLPTCDISVSSLKLPAPETGDFVELILLYFKFQRSAIFSLLYLTILKSV